MQLVSGQSTEKPWGVMRGLKLRRGQRLTRKRNQMATHQTLPFSLCGAVLAMKEVWGSYQMGSSLKNAENQKADILSQAFVQY